MDKERQKPRTQNRINENQQIFCSKAREKKREHKICSDNISRKGNLQIILDTHKFEHGVFQCGCLPKRQTTTTTPLNFHFSFIPMCNLGQRDPGTLLKNLL